MDVEAAPDRRRRGADRPPARSRWDRWTGQVAAAAQAGQRRSTTTATVARPGATAAGRQTPAERSTAFSITLWCLRPGCCQRKEVVDRRNGDGALADCGRAPLDRAVAYVARGEDTREVGLKGERAALVRPRSALPREVVGRP